MTAETVWCVPGWMRAEVPQEGVMPAMSNAFPKAEKSIQGVGWGQGGVADGGRVGGQGGKISQKVSPGEDCYRARVKSKGTYDLEDAKGRRRCMKIIRWVGCVIAAVGVLFVVVIVDGVLGLAHFGQYVEYPNKDALLAAESNRVVRCVDCIVDGKPVTIVDMGRLDFIGMYSAVLVYDAKGELIDKTHDIGLNAEFRQKWGGAW